MRTLFYYVLHNFFAIFQLITLYDKKIADGSLKFQFDRDLFWLSRGQHIGRKSVRPPTGKNLFLLFINR